MPPKVKITKKDIINKSIEIIKNEGYSALNARKIANVLGCSTQPIFSNFKSMNELKEELVKKTDEIYTEYRKSTMSKGNYPPYKASGMSYILFAKEQKELFKFLYMRDRTHENVNSNFESIDDVISIIQENLGISKKEAISFHIEMWVFVHGIATMIATDYLDLSHDTASEMITDIYQGQIKLLKDKGI